MSTYPGINCLLTMCRCGYYMLIQPLGQYEYLSSIGYGISRLTSTLPFLSLWKTIALSPELSPNRKMIRSPLSLLISHNIACIQALSKWGRSKDVIDPECSIRGRKSISCCHWVQRAIAVNISSQEEAGNNLAGKAGSGVSTRFALNAVIYTETFG